MLSSTCRSLWDPFTLMYDLGDANTHSIDFGAAQIAISLHSDAHSDYIA